MTSFEMARALLHYVTLTVAAGYVGYKLTPFVLNFIKRRRKP